jgi:hypothetical protein
LSGLASILSAAVADEQIVPGLQNKHRFRCSFLLQLGPASNTWAPDKHLAEGPASEQDALYSD